MPVTAPPPPPPRRSHRHVSHTDGETSGYHSDNHLIDPAVGNYHLRRQQPSSRGRVEPADTGSVFLDNHDGPNVISARADYKFLERKKWVQEGQVPYDLYPEVVGLIYRTIFFWNWHKVCYSADVLLCMASSVFLRFMIDRPRLDGLPDRWMPPSFKPSLLCHQVSPILWFLPCTRRHWLVSFVPALSVGDIHPSDRTLGDGSSFAGHASQPCVTNAAWVITRH